MKLDDVLAEIREFLLCPTPDAWVKEALQQQDMLLIDHANCEKKSRLNGDEPALSLH